MKKQISIVSCSALVLAIVASCSSNAPVMNNTGKVDSVSVSQINKVQANENGTVKVNLRLTTSQPKFAIKAVTQGWVSNNNISKVTLNLYDSSVATGTPSNRFDSFTPLATKPFTPSGAFSAGKLDLAGGVPPLISFNNLKAGKNYVVSARAYTSNFHQPGAMTVSGTSGAALLTLSATPTVGSRNQVFIGDIITVSGQAYTVTAIGGANLTVKPNLVATYSASAYTIETNITAEVGGSTNLGGSMGSNGLQYGGGTAAGIATNSTDEESITVNGAGLPQITNDGIFSGASPVRTAGSNQTLDVAIQLMKDYGGQADGAVRVYQGGYDNETITP